MADKAIGDLPAIERLQSDALIPVQQEGQAGRMTGQQFADFARESAAADVQKAVDSAKSAKASADKAEAASLNPPYIGDNGNWWVFNTTTGKYVDSGYGAKGPKGDTGANGVSPSVTVASISGGHRITITDANNPNGQTFDVLDGAGAGDMLSSVYDPQGKAQDIFRYVDDKFSSIVDGNNVSY